jgi:pimeloyl-ACP methyl ester carboxylesterase
LRNILISFPDVLAAYLAKGEYNVIGVDWSVLSPSPNYIAACRNAVPTGEHIAELVEFLVEQKGASHEDFHIIGHSLGAQVAGFAGNSTTTGKIGRITGQRKCN